MSSTGATADDFDRQLYGQKIDPRSNSLFGRENSLFGKNNSLFRQKNSLFHLLGNLDASI
jgi:hypothetical protein